jgi:hypothetical protein
MLWSYAPKAQKFRWCDLAFDRMRAETDHAMALSTALKMQLSYGDVRGENMPTRIHPIDVHVGNRLRERRLRLALGLEALGRTVGVRAQQIQKYENGRDRISSSRLYLLANALRVPVGFFFKELPEHGCASVSVRANRSRTSATQVRVDRARAGSRV